MAGEPTTAAATEPASRWRPWATIAVSTLAGPLIGVVALLIPFAIAEAAQNGLVAGVSMLAVAAFPFVWVIAFMIGVIPAAIGGMVLVALDRYAPRSVPRILAAALVGGAVTALFWLIFSGGRSQDGSIGWLAAIGAVSGGVCAQLTRRWRYRRN